MAETESKESKLENMLSAELVALTTSVINVIDKWQRFHYARHGKNPKAWTPVGALDVPTSAYWSASLINNLAANNLNVMKAIMAHDSISEQDLWPDPRPLSTIDYMELGRTISVWLQLEDQIFQALNSFYTPPSDNYANYSDNTPTPAFWHDALQKLAVQAIDFIQSENSAGYNPTIGIIPILGKPVDSVDQSTLIPSLQSMELGFHRLVQGHMQIATFIPKHLTIFIKEMKAKKKMKEKVPVHIFLK
jgi:hypothetical protein